MVDVERSAGAAPIVLVHGAWHGPWCWEAVAEGLRAAGREVIVPALPDHDVPGRRARLWRRAGEYVDAVEAVVRSLPSPPVLVGHSMGGYVVRRVLHRVEAAGAVLVAPVPRRGVAVTTGRLLGREPRSTLTSLATLSLWPIVSDPQRRSDAFLDHTADPDATALLAANVQNESYLAFAAMLLRPAGQPRRKVPMLVVAAESDPLFSVRQQRQLAEACGARFEVLPGGHDLMLHASKDRLVELIATWPTGNRA
jgi:pimeloyl-ACP methyl ester carboxylesterase